VSAGFNSSKPSNRPWAETIWLVILGGNVYKTCCVEMFSTFIHRLAELPAITGVNGLDKVTTTSSPLATVAGRQPNPRIKMHRQQREKNPMSKNNRVPSISNNPIETISGTAFKK